MSSPPQPASARRRTFEYSHQPEQGLHEWASRIKSIQAEVDQDEQAEQKRLEQEIAASRLARAQRRAKQGSRRLSDIGTSVPPDPEPMKTPESPTKPSSIFGARAVLMSPSTPGKNDPDSLTLPESPTKSVFGSVRTMTTNPSSSAKQNAPVSLAAFMGGRGSGPRLNKPAPQVDSHDPTLFDQTRRTGPAAAANAFQSAGRTNKWGQGVALPGLGPPPRQPSPTDKATPRSPRSPRFASPEDQPVVPQHTRQRTTSSPEKPGSPLQGSSPEAKSELTRSKTTGRTRAKSTSRTDSPPKRSDTLSPAFSTPNRNTPFKSHTTPTQGSSPTFGLARPIQPTPPAQDTNKLPLVSSAAPAFRSTVQASAKELSPSLTRLKGRGFVGNRIRQADGGVSPPSSLGISTNQFGEREKPKRAGTGNVQGRWQVAIQGQQGSSPSSASPMDVPWKRRSLKEPVPVVGDSKIAGIIKHMTGAQPSFPAAPPSPQKSSSPMDEFGRKPSPVVPKATPVPIQPVSGPEGTKSAIQPKPLNHLTRDRARKPKKGVQVKGVWDTPEVVSTTPASTPPQDHRPPSPFKRLRPATSQPSMRPPSPIKESPLRRQGTLPRAQTSPRAEAHPSHMPPSPIRKPAQLFPAVPRSESPTKESNISRAKDLWGERAPIGIKPQNSGKRGTSPGPASRGPNLVGKRALPGMVAAPQPQQRTLPQPIYGRPESPSKPSTPKPVSPISPPRHAGPPPSPGRNKSRATVMELAQAMSEKQGETEEFKLPPSPRPAPAARERRRSSYNQHSVITMPPLKEEKSPVPTPAGTLSKSQELSVPQAEPMPVSTSPKTSPRISPKPSPRLSPKPLSPKPLSPRPSPKVQPAPLPAVNKVDGVFRVDQNMAPIPPFNLQQVINSNPYNFTFPPNFKRISTDAFSLSGDRATLVSSSPCLVYDSEMVAVVQRVRNETNGLVLSKVWGWCGKKAQPGGKEEGKLVELAKQYGTSVIPAFQGDESQELVDAVGGHWIIRQGTRAHWTPENTTMHCTRRLGDACFTDEVDFHVSNLCSAYSYCVTVLDAVYVWHGRGTTQPEREAAAAYGRAIAGPEKEIEEFEEGKEDPMFFMILGDHAWANADYWKYRAPLGKAAYRQRMFLIDARNKKQPVSCHIPSANKIAPDTIFVLDGILEMMVVVGPEARGRRTDILLAVHVAISVATSVETKRPFVPPVHLIVLPSQLPLEVKAGFFRFVSDELVNPAGVPSHMHLLTLSEASDQLSALTLPMSKLQDPTFLPLGVHPSLLN